MKTVRTNVTDAQLVAAQRGTGGHDGLLWVECPSDYNPSRITASDIIHDSQIRVVDAPADDTGPDAAELDARLRAQNMTLWLELQALKLGTQNQRERHGAGVLPEDELLALARNELYAPLKEWARWKNRDLHAREVNHERTCAAAENAVQYRTLGGPALPPMDANSWNRLAELRHAVNLIATHDWLVWSHTKVDVQVTLHEAYCTRCQKRAQRYAVKVCIPFAGRSLVREYAL